VPASRHFEHLFFLSDRGDYNQKPGNPEITHFKKQNCICAMIELMVGYVAGFLALAMFICG